MQQTEIRPDRPANPVRDRFGLARDPFSASWAPRWLTMRSEVLALLANIESALADGSTRPVAIEGPPGSGRALVLDALQNALTGKGRRVVRAGSLSAVGADDLLTADVLILPDADVDIAERVGRVTGLRLVTSIAADAAALGESVVHPMPLLRAADMAGFVRDGLIAAGGRTDIFTSGAVKALGAAADGRFQRARVLAANAMFDAAFDDADRVDSAHINAAVASLPPVLRLEDDEDGRKPVISLVQSDPAPEETDEGETAKVASDSSGNDTEIRIAPREAAALTTATHANVPLNDDDDPETSRRGLYAAIAAVVLAAIAAGGLFLAKPDIFTGATPNRTAAAAPAPESDAVATAARDESSAIPARSDEDTLATTGADVASTTSIADVAAAEIQEGEPTDGAVAPDDETLVDTVAADDAAEGAAAEAPLPVVVVHYSEAQPDGLALAADATAFLRARGYDVRPPRSVPFGIGRASTRYFHPDDADSAAALNATIAGLGADGGVDDVRVMDMVASAGAAQAGQVELWIAVPG